MHENEIRPENPIEDFRAIESAIEQFDAKYADYDFSSFSFEQLWKLEDRLHHYPAYKVQTAVYKARVAAAERMNQEIERRRQALRDRYGYYCAGEDVTKGLLLHDVKTYERTIINTLYETMDGKPEETIRDAIRKCIPPITDNGQGN